MLDLIVIADAGWTGGPALTGPLAAGVPLLRAGRPCPE